MRRFIIVILLFLLFSSEYSLAQVNIEWKLAPNDTLYYSLDIAQSYIQGQNQGVWYVAVHRHRSGYIQATLYQPNPFAQMGQMFSRMMQSMRQRGGEESRGADSLMQGFAESAMGDAFNADSITYIQAQQVLFRPTGGAVSFWEADAVESMVAPMLMLPGKVVQVGETWNFDFDMITSIQFASNPDTVSRHNSASLVQLRQAGNSQIGIIRAEHHDYARFPNSRMPGMFRNLSQEFMDSTLQLPQDEVLLHFIGNAEFDITLGRLEKFEGSISLNMLGFGSEGPFNITLLSAKPAAVANATGNPILNNFENMDRILPPRIEQERGSER